MALKKPLVLTDGMVEQLQVGDTLDAVVAEMELISKTNGNAGSLVIGTPVYCKATGEMDKAQANASGTIHVIGLVKDVSVSAATPGYLQTSGPLAATTGQWDAVAGTTGGLVPGTPYYLDAATAGKLTATAPATGGQFVVKLGIALSTTELLIRIDAPLKL